MDSRGTGDAVEYLVDVRNAGGPFRVEAEPWYRPIAFRCARTTSRRTLRTRLGAFVSYYTSMSESSAVVLARAAR